MYEQPHGQVGKGYVPALCFVLGAVFAIAIHWVLA